MVKLDAKELRKSVKGQILNTRKNEIYIILDNVLDTYNIGSIFRLADAIAAKKVYLCGETSIPPNPRIKKASINTTEIVEWEYSASTVEAIAKLKTQKLKIQVVAVEQSERAVAYDKFEYHLPVALVVGHETYGVSRETLEAVDAVVEIPMYGINVSLNVMVSLAIVAYKVLEKTKEL
ncbi:TrmH family RNA methyltransferase [candidate division WS5 bacterium]|uniref:TrmH family RNA methyltransferase n=1 Tax=candidate division WS5 bacterium TaxID=2093353 RepID=A0A419DH08_9BACT|nr:MAG: TrmH family RNA methyltransferase [candidate division WS5 bacterium]